MTATDTTLEVGTVLRQRTSGMTFLVVEYDSESSFGLHLCLIENGGAIRNGLWWSTGQVSEACDVLDPPPYLLCAGYVWTRDLDPELRADARWTCGRYAVENYANDGYVDGDSWMVIPSEDGEWFDTRKEAMTYVASLLDSAAPWRVPT